MGNKYILADHTPVKVTDVFAWARWFETADRHVARDTIAKGVEVSTVFLSLDRSFGKGLPLLFETLILGGKCDGDIRRYATWQEAEIGHAEECARVLREIHGLAPKATKEEADGTKRLYGVQ